MGYRKENEVRYEACASRIVEAFSKYRRVAGKSEDVRLTFNGDSYKLASDGSFEKVWPCRDDIRKLEKDVEKLEDIIDKKVDELAEKKSDDVTLPEDLLSNVSFVFAIAEALPIEVFDEYCKWRHFEISRNAEELVADLKVGNITVTFVLERSTGNIYYEVNNCDKSTLENDLRTAHKHLKRIVDAFEDQPRSDKHYTARKSDTRTSKTPKRAVDKERKAATIDAFKEALKDDDADKLINAAVAILKRNDPDELVECTKLLATDLIKQLFD